MTVNDLTSLPDVLFYNILTYIERPTNIVVLICKSIAPICSSANDYVKNDSLWELILGAYTDGTLSSNRRQRRQSKRLRRTTAKEDVMHTFSVMRANTDMALHEFTELAMSKDPHPLSLARLRCIIRHYGPNLNINQLSTIGGTFLVDCCRARYVKESVILACLKELINKHGAKPNVCAMESLLWSKKPKLLPPLVVAAARGMSSVVKFLVEDAGASISLEGTSRFRLFKKPSKSICGTFTALKFAQTMKEAEITNGANQNELSSLNKCIQILSLEKN